MVQKSHETVLKYKTDTKGIKDLGRALKDALNVRTARDMGRAFRDSRKELAGLRKEHVALNKEFLKTKEGTKQFQTLEKAIAKVEQRMGRLKRVMGSAKPGAGGFSQGLFQGIAPQGAGFLQRGPGMRAQFAGQMAGQAARGGMMRGVNAAFSPSGIGALTSGIPVLGGLAQMATQAVGQARERQQAELQAIMTSGGFGVKGLRSLPYSDKRSANLIAAARAKASALAMAAPGSQSGVMARSERILTGPADEEITRGFPKMTAQQRHVMYATTELSAEDRAAGVTRAGNIAAAAEKKRIADANAAVAEENRRLLTSNLRKSAAVGRRFGLTRTQMTQQIGQFGATIGGGVPDPTMTEGIMGAQLQGVTTQTAAQFMRGTRAGRGGTAAATSIGAVNMMAKAIGQAVSMELEGSEINEYLGQISSLQSQAEQQGIKLSAEGFGNLAQGLSGAGFAGPQASRVAAAATRYGQGVATRGVNGPLDIMAARAAGFRPGAGAANYVSAMESLEGGMTPDVLESMVRGMTGGIRGDSDDARAKRALGVKRGLATGGITVGFGQARKLAASLRGGGFQAELAKIQAGEKLPGGGRTGQDLLDATKGPGLKSLAALLTQNADTQDKMVNVGTRMADLVQTLEDNTAELTGSATNLLRPLKVLTPAIKNISDKLDDASITGGEGLSDIFKAIMGIP